MAYTFSTELVSDLHKDAHGFRPREGFWLRWNSANDDVKQVIWDRLIEAFNREMDEDKRRKDKAVADYESTLATNMKYGAPDRETAKRWWVESLKLDAWDLAYGGSRVCYEVGLPFEMAKEFDGICKELLEEAGGDPFFKEVR